MKNIIILDGNSRGKTLFAETAKERGYWTWQVNHKNVLAVVAHKMFWDGNRNSSYYDFVEEIEELANRYFNFEEKYLASMIEKFERNEKTQLLIVHSCSKKLRDEILKIKDTAVSINVVDQKGLEECDGYSFVLYEGEPLNEKAYKDVVVDILETIQNKKKGDKVD